MTTGGGHGIMWCVADPNESHGDRRPQDPEDHLPDRSRAPEVVDAEVVEDGPASSTGAAPPSDDEQFRQYQQFLEFQKFQEWQRSQQGLGGGADLAVPTPPSAPAQAPPAQPVQWPDAPQGGPPAWPETSTAHRGTVWFRRLLWPLRFKLVRRLIYLLVIVIVAYNLIGVVLTDLFGGGRDDSRTGTGGAPPNSSPITSTNPADAVSAVYNSLRENPPSKVCDLFSDQAKGYFATVHQAPDCNTAANRLHEQITAPASYAAPGFGPDAIEEVNGKASVYSCFMQVTGGPKLGSFGLTRQRDGGWIISGYELEPDRCRR
ncbi:hypothetical protein A8924_7228 [Saccharopolyspora erythraea NRRL 2338]|nr:hypothetical protein N599_06980 [Saccharopolyspora erythraea D]PFG99678.1 hypothetical protein A8924_7228 [Saccharopolyspora erythraea NRRL 2338]